MTKQDFWKGLGNGLLKGALWCYEHKDELLAALAAIEAAKKGQSK